MHVAENRASRSSAKLLNTKSLLHLLKYVLETLSIMKYFIKFWCSNWLAAVLQYLDLVYHAELHETCFSFVSCIALTRDSDYWTKLMLLFTVL